MGGLSFWHILIFALVVLVLFGGKGKISDIMTDFAKGIKSFRKGLEEESDHPTKIVSEKTPHSVNDPLSEGAEKRIL